MAFRSRVLIVDDEIETREVLADLLRARGYDVDIFDGGSRALEFLQVGPRPKVIVLDLLLRSDMNGWQFLEIVKKHPELRDIPVIAISGADLTPQHRLQCKAEAFLAKPVHPHLLIALLREYGAAPSRDGPDGSSPTLPS
jgi:CheY-like chemotaxis protein